MKRRARLACAVAVVGASVISACGSSETVRGGSTTSSPTSSSTAPTTTGDEVAPTTTRPQTTYVQELQVGDCFDDPSIATGAATEVLEVTAVADCEMPHDGEAYAIVEYAASPNDPYPAPEAIEAFVEAECMAQFGPFVGVEWVVSPTLDIYAYRPTARSWTIDGDREVVCAIIRLDRAKITGTTQGTAQ